MRLLLERNARRARERETERLALRSRLREALAELCPSREIFVFGSLTRTGKFFRRSDVDIAFEQLPEGVSPYGLAGLLEEKVGRPVDLVLLGETRLREKIQAEAERWIVSA